MPSNDWFTTCAKRVNWDSVCLLPPLVHHVSATWACTRVCILFHLALMYFIYQFLSECWNVLTLNSTFNLLLLALSAATVSSSPIMCPLFTSFLRPRLRPQALYGSCAMKGGESLAVWTLKGTSLSDNGTRVVCQKAGNTDAPTAVLHVYGKYSGNALYQGPYNKHKLILTFLSVSLN